MAQLRSNYYYASSDMYQVLGFFTVLTTRELAKAIQSGILVDDIKSILNELGYLQQEIEMLTAGFEAFTSQNDDVDELFHAVRRDYTHLFTNPKISVSTLLESSFFNEQKDLVGAAIPLNKTIQEAKAAYQRAGYSPSFNPPLRSDHLAVQLEFMQTLRRNQGLALDAKDEKVYAEITATAQDFVAAHLSKWAVDLFRDIEQKANEEVYRFIGALGTDFFTKEFATS